MKNINLIALFLICFSAANAQVSLKYRPGYGTYLLTNLSFLQERILSKSEFPAKITDQFPGYINHKLMIHLPKQRGDASFFLGYLTTGGRISLTDYSGKWHFDMKLNGIKAGLHKEYPFEKFNRFNIKTYFDFGTTLTYLKVTELIEIEDEKISASSLFVGHGIDLEPGFIIKMEQPRFTIGLFCGFELDIAMAFYKRGGFRRKLHGGNRPVRPNWTGLRTGLQIDLNFKKINDQALSQRYDR